MDLRNLLRDPTTSLEQVAAGLDALGHAARVQTVEACDRSELLRLWELSAEAPGIDAAQFVGDRGPRVPTIHDGWNSLPLPRASRRFQKVFARPEPGGEDRIFGYNEGSSRSLIGPGYFQLLPSAPDRLSRGAWVVDYFKVPDGPVPDSGPPEDLRNVDSNGPTDPVDMPAPPAN